MLPVPYAVTHAVSVEQARRYASVGFSFIALASDLGLMTSNARTLLRSVRELPHEAPAVADEKPALGAY